MLLWCSRCSRCCCCCNTPNRSAWGGATRARRTCHWWSTPGLSCRGFPSAPTSSPASAGRRRRTTRTRSPLWRPSGTIRSVSSNGNQPNERVLWTFVYTDRLTQSKGALKVCKPWHRQKAIRQRQNTRIWTTSENKHRIKDKRTDQVTKLRSSKHTNELTIGQAHGDINRPNKQTNKQTNTQTNNRSNKQTSRQTDRQTTQTRKTHRHTAFETTNQTINQTTHEQTHTYKQR